MDVTYFSSSRKKKIKCDRPIFIHGYQFFKAIIIKYTKDVSYDIFISGFKFFYQEDITKKSLRLNQIF